jgi:hypothetical protein
METKGKKIVNVKVEKVNSKFNDQRQKWIDCIRRMTDTEFFSIIWEYPEKLIDTRSCSISEFGH